MVWLYGNGGVWEGKGKGGKLWERNGIAHEVRELVFEMGEKDMEMGACIYLSIY